MLFLFSGEVQPAVSPNPRTEVDGPTRRGLPVFQAHAGERPPRHPPDGNAPCKKKKLVITREWFASDSGWGAWKDWVKSARAPSPRAPSASLPSAPSSCSSSRCHMFASCVRVQIVLNICSSLCTRRICSHICLHVYYLLEWSWRKKCVHSVEKEKEGWNQYNSWFSLVLTYVKKSCLFSKD